MTGQIANLDVKCKVSMMHMIALLFFLNCLCDPYVVVIVIMCRSKIGVVPFIAHTSIKSRMNTCEQCIMLVVSVCADERECVVQPSGYIGYR